MGLLPPTSMLWFTRHNCGKVLSTELDSFWAGYIQQLYCWVIVVHWWSPGVCVIFVALKLESRPAKIRQGMDGRHETYSLTEDRFYDPIYLSYCYSSIGVTLVINATAFVTADILWSVSRVIVTLATSYTRSGNIPLQLRLGRLFQNKVTFGISCLGP